MKKLSLIGILFFSCACAMAQQISLPPSGDNEKAMVAQWIGPVQVSINYSSPDVHGPNGEDRKGHIWGELVFSGFKDSGFASKGMPWRAGANENTVITFSNDVKVAGKDLKAGTYALFLDYETSGSSNWIFSNNSTSWGSFYYDPKEDALRIPATAEDAPYTEYLTFGFDNRKSNSAVAYLQWENKRFSFPIEVPNVNDLYVSAIRDELRNQQGFDYRNYVTAAQFCAQKKINLDEALAWVDRSMNPAFGGVEDFNALSTKAMVLSAMGRDPEAAVIMDKAIKVPGTSVFAIHQYGRTLLASGKTDKAMEIFQFNQKAHPEEKFVTYVGLARAYTALGDKKNAIKNWEIALKGIPDNQKPNIKTYEAELNKLKEG